MRPTPVLLALLALPLSAQAPLIDALKAGKASLEIRTRFEHVDDSDFKAPADHKTANGFTNRTFLGFESGAWEGIKLTLQAANVVALGEERFNSGLNGKTTLATIQDPGATEVLQANLSWKGFKLGRQTLRVDNQRFVGAGMWSQMPKAYTGLTFQGDLGAKWVNLHAGHITQMTDSLSRTRALKLDFVRARFVACAEAAITPFWFANEETTKLYGATPDGSVQHMGLRVDGAWKGLLYDGTVAKQKAWKESKNTAERSYLSLTAGYAFTKDISLKVTHEVLEGAAKTDDEVLEGAAKTDAIQNAFTTPQASLHGFYGWADRLGATPVTGIVDDFVQLEAKRWGFVFDVQFHSLKPEQTDRGFSKYGTDLSASVAFPVTKNYELMLKVADYKGESTAVAPMNKDLKKVWLVSTFKF